MIEHVEAAVKSFLEHDRNVMLVIKGPWGSGKTFAWKVWIEKYKSKKTPYAYVSLFGCQNIEDLKTKIIAGFQNDFTIGSPSYLEKCKKAVQFFADLGKEADPKGLVAAASHIASAVLPSPWSQIEQAIICFDDYERKNPNITASDFFGLLTELKDEKKCKIVLLLNEDVLRQSGNLFQEYRQNIEKIVDRPVAFEATPAEKLDLALNHPSFVGDLNIFDSEILKREQKYHEIHNIRILHKILGYLCDILKFLNGINLERGNAETKKRR